MDYRQGLVDMGSNGIRFSITDLSPSQARLLPTLYQDRLGVSLYDAQYGSESESARHPISQGIISTVTTSLQAFQQICEDYYVSPENVTVLATEATRTAPNSEEFRRQIREETGLEVKMLSKSEEGRIGTLGIASSFDSTNAEGLVMDLGGGSTQLSWMTHEHGELILAADPVSLPYGAAAVTKQLNQKDGLHILRDHMSSRLKEALVDCGMPTMHQQADGNRPITLYLSGGGFRGIGYLLLASHKIQPYPIPIINGFSVPGSDFFTLAHELHQNPEAHAGLSDTFGVSKRRAAQVPAVVLLIESLKSVLPPVKEVIFTQGGVREGFLFSTLPTEIRNEHPIRTAAAPYTFDGAEHIHNTLVAHLPPGIPESLREITHAAADMMMHHNAIHKESRATVALNVAISGTLAGTHGLTHFDRAGLGLILSERWGGDVFDEGLRDRLIKLLDAESAYWCRYLGRSLGVLGAAWPAGVVRLGTEERVRIHASLKDDGDTIFVTVTTKGLVVKGEAFEKAVKGLKKVGKKKNCSGFRKKVEVVVEEES